MKPIIVVLTLVTILLTQVRPAHAIAPRDLKAITEDTVWLDEKTDGVCDDGSNLTGGDLIGVDNPQKAFNYFVMDRGLTKEQSAAIVGNLIRESNVNPASDNPAAKNGGGGIAQWEGGRWSGPGGLLAFAQKAGKPWQDFRLQLDFMWAELNGIAPVGKQPGLAEIKAAKSMGGYPAGSVEAMAVAFEEAFERPRDNHWAQSAGNARKVLTKYGDQAPAAGTATTPSGTTCLTGGNGGGIVGTALSDLSWPKPDCDQQAYGATRKSCKDSTPAYAAKGGTNTNPGGSDAFTDCGTFVATVMHLSGADPKYPRVQTGTQLSYVKSHPELYKIIPKDGKLEPGDILVNDGHTMIYVGEQGGPGLPRADASWHDHTPQRGKAGGIPYMLNKSDTAIARYIGTTPANTTN